MQATPDRLLDGLATTWKGHRSGVTYQATQVVRLRERLVKIRMSANNRVNRAARKRRLRVPSSVRSSAAGSAER